MKKKLLLIIKVVITLLILYIIFKKFDYKNLILIFKNVNLLYIFFAILIVPFIILMRSIKWFLLLKYSKINITLFESFKSITGGLAFGILTPGRIGEVTRSLFLEHKKKIEISGLVLLDRLIDLYVIILYSLYGITVLIKNMGLTIFVFFLFTIFTLFIFIRYIRSIFSKIGTKSNKKLIAKLNGFIKEFKHLSPIQSLLLILISMTMYFLTFFQFYILLSAFSTNPNINFLIALKTSPLIQFMSVIPITLFGLGLREGTSIALLSHFGINKLVAFNSAFLSFVFNILLTALIGLIFLLQLKIHKK